MTQRRHNISRSSLPQRRGLTLVELATSMAITAILMGGLASTILVATRALDSGTGPAAKASEAADVLNVITADLNVALSYTEWTDQVVTFTVPDRDGDEVPDTLRYAWSGTPGDPLTRQCGAGPVVTIAEDVQDFAFQRLKRTLIPPPQACCLEDGSCQDVSLALCDAGGGTAQGPETNCATVECPAGITILFVVTDVTGPTDQEATRQALMESWGFTVSLIAATDSQANFDATVADVNVAHVSEEIAASDLGTKLRDAPVGVVNGEIELQEEFGIGTVELNLPRTEIKILDNTHYITSQLALGYIPILSSTQPVNKLNGETAPGLEVLAEVWDTGGENNNKPTLCVLESGAQLYGGGVAPARRVQLPWGTGTFDINALNADGLTIMKRAIEWAAGQEEPPAVCGDGTCGAGEDSCGCPADCGDPVSFEQPGVDCDDGLDNDCDGQADCDDINCFADPACVICGNGVCELGEDCISCPDDCPGKTSGKPANQYCCGNGVLESPEGDGSICDGNP